MRNAVFMRSRAMFASPRSRPQAGRGDKQIHDFVRPRRSLRGLRHWRGRREVDHLERCADALRGAVLEADYGVDGNVVLAAIDRVDDVAVFLVDDAAANLSR